MFKTKFHKLMKHFLTGMLCAGILTSQPAVTYAAETSATPEAGHSETYSQARRAVMILVILAGYSLSLAFLE